MNATTVGFKMFPPLATLLLCAQLTNMDKGHIFSPSLFAITQFTYFPWPLSIISLIRTRKINWYFARCYKPSTAKGYSSETCDIAILLHSVFAMSKLLPEQSQSRTGELTCKMLELKTNNVLLF